MDSNSISYQIGLPEHCRSAAVELYDEVFAHKLSVAVRSPEDRKRLLRSGFALEYAIGAIAGGQLLGIAGLQTSQGSLTGSIGFSDLVTHLGVWKGIWAAVIFDLYERTPGPSELILEGIAVRANARDMGIGSALLDTVRTYARQHGYERILLEVIDTNPKAQKLYARMGFEPLRTERFPYLKSLLGFGGATTMALQVK